MKRLVEEGNAVCGLVVLSKIKALRNGGHLLIGLGSLIYFRDFSAMVAAMVITLVTMYFGVVAYHRLIIHRSFKCPKRVEYLLICIANLSGFGSPGNLIRIHDLRDWAQRQKKCHPYFCHRENIFKDGLQQLFCEVQLTDPPAFKVEIEDEAFYRHMDKFWYFYQLPLGIILYTAGGWSWVGAGIFLKMFSIQFGHWFISYLLHNFGKQPVIVKSAGVQGFNIPLLALLTFGESYHNNHHLYPEAAKNSFSKYQIDPAWWLICLLERSGLAKNVKFYHTGNK